MIRPSRRSAHAVAIALCAVLGFAACGISIPEDKQLYIGHWNNAEVSLRIDSNGTVTYKRSGSIGHTTINGPIQEFRGDDFVVGLPLLNTTFEVSSPPWFEGRRWRMVVDGVELVRDGQSLAGRSAEVAAIAVTVLDAGIFGRRRSDSSRPIMKSTTRIPAKLNTGFGVSFSFDAPAGGPVLLTFHCMTPRLRDPKTGKVTERYTLQMRTPQGGPHWFACDFDEPWELVPGEWAISIAHGDRVLSHERFEVYRPG